MVLLWYFMYLLEYSKEKNMHKNVLTEIRRSKRKENLTPISLRIPTSLANKLKNISKENSIPLNKLIVILLDDSLERE